MLYLPYRHELGIAFWIPFFEGRLLLLTHTTHVAKSSAPVESQTQKMSDRISWWVTAVVSPWGTPSAGMVRGVML